MVAATVNMVLARARGSVRLGRTVRPQNFCGCWRRGALLVVL